MRELKEISEAQIKAEYDITPAVNQFVTWPQVKEFSPLYQSLRNQVFAKLNQGEPINTLERVQTGSRGNVLGLVVQKPQPQQATPIKQAKVAVISARSSGKLRDALQLARTCLQVPSLSNAHREEAIKALAEALAIIQPKKKV